MKIEWESDDGKCESLNEVHYVVLRKNVMAICSGDEMISTQLEFDSIKISFSPEDLQVRYKVASIGGYIYDFSSYYTKASLEFDGLKLKLGGAVITDCYSVHIDEA